MLENVNFIMRTFIDASELCEWTIYLFCIISLYFLHGYSKTLTPSAVYYVVKPSCINIMVQKNPEIKTSLRIKNQVVSLSS